MTNPTVWKFPTLDGAEIRPGASALVVLLPSAVIDQLRAVVAT